MIQHNSKEKNMGRFRLLVMFIVFSFFFCAHTYAGIQKFAGTWINTDSDTRGVVKLKITGTGRQVFMQAWGKCHPKNCDWGQVTASPYANSINQDMIRQGNTLTGIFNSSFSQTIVIVRLIATDRLRADLFTRFTDNSSRNNYHVIYQMKKAASGGTFGNSPRAPEDCIRFNPDRVTMKKSNNRWKIVEGSHWIMDFETNRTEAMQSLKIIKRFRLDSICFVGRPDPSFTYFLANGKAPSGSIDNEDCVRFNPTTIQVKRIGSRWKIVDGSHLMFDFGTNRTEAFETYKIIKRYRFSKSCFVGRPDPSMTYMKK